MHQGLLYGKNSFVAEVTFKAIHFEISFLSPLMIGTSERVFPGGMSNVYFQFLDLKIHFNLSVHHKFESFSQPW